MFPTPAVESAYQAPRRPIDRVCGAFITTFGIKLMLNRV